MAGDSITPLGVPGAYTDYSNYMMNPYMMNSYMSPYMNPYMMNGSSAAMMGMGYYNPSFYGQWMREMNQLNAQMEKDKLAHTTDMHALTQQAEVQNMSIHDRTFFEKAMVDGDMAKDIRNLAEVVRSGDQDAICEEYDKIKRSVLTKYSDFFSTSQGRINVTDKVNDYICDIYSEYVKKWTGQPADLFRQSNRGVHCSQRADEGFFCPSGGAFYRQRQCGRNLHRFEPLDGHPKSH